MAKLDETVDEQKSNTAVDPDRPPIELKFAEESDNKIDVKPSSMMERMGEHTILEGLFGKKTSVEKERESLATLFNAMPEEERKKITGADTGTLERFINESDQPLADLQKFQTLKRTAESQKLEDLRYAKEDRLARQFQLENMKYYGDTVDEDDISDIRKRTGNDLNVIIETYGLDAKIDPETGLRSYSIPPADVLKDKATALTLKPSEIDYLGGIVEGKDAMQEAIDMAKSIGINDLNKIGNITWDDTGPFSIPATFNVVGQFAKDPKYTALKLKLERAFQAYRKVITGAQASNQELSTLRPLIANFKQRPEIFMAVANDLVSESSRIYDRRLGLYKRAGRDVTPLVGYIQQKPGTNPITTSTSPQGKTITAPSGRVITLKGR